jgi:hypothetical protein
MDFQTMSNYACFSVLFVVVGIGFVIVVVIVVVQFQ